MVRPPMIIFGNILDNLIFGNGGADVIEGGAGADIIYGDSPGAANFSDTASYLSSSAAVNVDLGGSCNSAETLRAIR